MEYPCRDERHGVGKGGERRRERRQERERRRERRGRAGGGGTRKGTAKGKLGASGGGAAGARAKKGARWSCMCRSTGQPISGTVPIRFGTYNIRNGRNGGLESALRGMSQANIDLGIFQ